MSLEITGKVFKVLAEQTGTGKNGVWVKQDFVIETDEQFPKKAVFSAWGDKAASVKNLQSGERVKVSFNVEAREYNEKWFTDLRAWKIDKIGAAQTSSSNVSSSADDFPTTFSSDSEDSLPF